MDACRSTYVWGFVLRLTLRPKRGMLTQFGPERFGLILQTVSINNVRLSHDPGIRPVCSGCDPWFALRVLGHGL